MTDDSQTRSLRQYLLGAPLAADQQRELEERLFTDDECCEQLDIIEDELIEQFLNDELSADERARFEAAFLTTAERKEKLRVARALNKYVKANTALEPAASQTNNVESIAVSDSPAVLRLTPRVPFWSRSPKLTYAGLAAALLLVVFGGLLWRSYSRQAVIESGLVALNEAYRQQRPGETRITALEYAPPPETRGTSTDKLDYAAHDRAVRILQDAAHEQKTSAALHALGQLYLAEREYDKAIGQFEAALATTPNDASLHSDLGAALMDRGDNEPSQTNTGAALGDLASSLEHLNRALALDPALLDAVFNRALLYQRMKLPQQAAAEWQHYLDLDPNSQWAEEARRKLKLIEQARSLSGDTSQTLNDFVDAHRARDEERAWQILSGSREMISQRMVAFQLAHNALQAQDERHAKELLNALKYAGDLERNRSQDPFFAELATYYSATHTGEQRRQLAEAASELSEGYRLCKASQYDEAQKHFARAQSLFSAAGNTNEARLTDYWLAYCDTQADHLEKSEAVLDELTTFCRQRSYRWLLSQALYGRSNSKGLSGAHSQALALGRQALEIAVSINDIYNQQKLLTQIALQYLELGRSELALDYHQRTLSLAGLGAPSPRQNWRTYTYIAQSFYTLRKYDAAAAYQHEALSLSLDELHDPSLTHFSYTRLGTIFSRMGDYSSAIKEATAGLEVARRVENDSASRKMVAYSLLQLGHLSRQSGDCTAALAHYDEAVKMYDVMEIGKLDGYDAHKGRLLCYLNRHDDGAIEAELPRVLALFEQNRAEIAEEQNRNSFFAAEQDVFYDIAINYTFGRGDKRRAFEYSEQSRARSLLDLLTYGVSLDAAGAEPDVTFKANASSLDLATLQAQLPAHVQVVQYTVMNDRLLIWFISPTRFEVFEKSITAADLQARVLAYVGLLTRHDDANLPELNRQAAALYELLIAPVTPLLDSAAEVCIVPDKTLFRLPFAALVAPDSGRYLVQDYTLLFAPSASVLVRCSQTAEQRRNLAHAERVLSVGNPAFDRSAYPQLADLPAAEVEANRVAQIYGGEAALTEARAQKALFTERITQAEVIHFAGHYLIDEHSPMRSRLLLAKNVNGEALTAAEVFDNPLPHLRLVVLSACETELESYDNGEGMIGLARTFLAAGAPLVVASQWPVNSDATAYLMIRFHQLRRVDGVSTSMALRRAQEEMLTGSDIRLRNLYYWAAFLPVGGHAEY